MESELGDAPSSQLGHVPVTLCFIDLTGFTRYTEEEGDLEALDVVENFVADGRGDAAAGGDDREDDRRRGDGRLARPGLADRVGGRPPRPLPRAPAAAGRDPLRRGRLPRRRLLRHPRQPRPPRRRPRPGRRGAGHRRASPRAIAGARPRAASRSARSASRASRSRPSSSSSAPPTDRHAWKRACSERVRGGAACSRRRDAGGGDALRRPRLGLPARPRGPAARGRGGHARCTSTTGCATTPTRTSAHCVRALRAARGRARGRAPAPPRGPGQPPGLGPRRPLRGGGAARPRRRSD